MRARSSYATETGLIAPQTSVHSGYGSIDPDCRRIVAVRRHRDCQTIQCGNEERGTCSRSGWNAGDAPQRCLLVREHGNESVTAGYVDALASRVDEYVIGIAASFLLRHPGASLHVECDKLCRIPEGDKNPLARLVQRHGKVA